MLHVRDSLHQPQRTAAELMRPVLTFPKSTPVYEALRLMRETRNHLATVTDAERVIGVLTLNDVLERLLATESAA